MTQLADLQTALPGHTVSDHPQGVGYLFAPSLSDAEWLIAEKIINPFINKSSSARFFAKNIPNWASWSQDDWATYFNSNLANGNVTTIANLAEAKLMLTKQNTIINALAKMVIALRDHTRITE